MRGTDLLTHITPLEDREYENIVQTLADNTVANSRGSSTATSYMLEPKMWLKELVNAGKKRFRYVESAYQVDIPKGHSNAIIPKRNNYLASSAYATSVTPGTAVSYTTMNNFDSVEVVPSWKNYGHAITYDTIQQNALDYVALAREELSYHAGDEVDQAIVTAVSGATLSTSTAAGMQQIFGGDATRASELANGDVITTDMVAEAMRKLQTDITRYWTGGSGETAVAKATAVKNPWINEGDFNLYIAPEQEEAFRIDSQFVNAAEYGSGNIVQNGEIGKYLGASVIVSVNTMQVAANGVGTIDTSTAAVDMNSCVLTKARKGFALAFGRRPTLHVVDFPRELEVDLILEQPYGTKIIHTDSLVAINVSQV